MSRTTADPEAPWAAWQPDDLLPVLAGVDVDWWVSGGWALDLFLGGRSRDHADLDVSVFRADFGALAASLPGWDIFLAGGGRLVPWEVGSPIPPSIHSVWLRPKGSPLWHFEVLLEEREGDAWVYRRDPTIMRPVSDVVMLAGELRIVRPEIQLLYKSKQPRNVDAADFGRVAGRLPRDDRQWLRDALAHLYGDHPWLAVLTSDG